MSFTNSFSRAATGLAVLAGTTLTVDRNQIAEATPTLQTNPVTFVIKLGGTIDTVHPDLADVVSVGDSWSAVTYMKTPVDEMPDYENAFLDSESIIYTVYKFGDVAIVDYNTDMFQDCDFFIDNNEFLLPIGDYIIVTGQPDLILGDLNGAEAVRAQYTIEDKEAPFDDFLISPDPIDAFDVPRLVERSRGIFEVLAPRAVRLVTGSVDGDKYDIIVPSP